MPSHLGEKGNQGFSYACYGVTSKHTKESITKFLVPSQFYVSLIR